MEMVNKVEMAPAIGLRELGFLPIEEAAARLGMKTATLYGYKKQTDNATYQDMFLQMRPNAAVWVEMSKAYAVMFKDREERVQAALEAVGIDEDESDL